jgi:hypothetical protein
MSRLIVPSEPDEKFPALTPDVPHSRTPFGFCHHLRSAEADASCSCGYRGGIWSRPDDRIVFEMGQTPCIVDGKPEKMLPEADRLTQIADAHFIVRACNSYDELLAALKAVARVINDLGRINRNGLTHQLVLDVIEKAEGI